MMLARFRTSDRDQQTDAERIDEIRSGMRRVLLSIEKERDGLTRRLENARTRSASLLSNQDGIYFQREPADEKRLAEAESQMTYAYARLDHLQSQRAVLAGMLGHLDKIEAEPVPSRLPRHGLFRQIGGALDMLSLVTGRWICTVVGCAILVAVFYTALGR